MPSSKELYSQVSYKPHHKQADTLLTTFQLNVDHGTNPALHG